MQRGDFIFYWLCATFFISGLICRVWLDSSVLFLIIIATSASLIYASLKYKTLAFVSLVIVGFAYAQFLGVEPPERNKQQNLDIQIAKDLRTNISNNINSLIIYPDSELAKGMTYGDDSQIPSDIKKSFRDLGISHILAVSGSNIIILIGFLYFLIMPLLGRYLFTAFLLFFIFTFLLLTGLESSILRAVIMAMSVFSAGMLGRMTSGFFSLLLAGFIMIIIHPSIIRYDLGFQLSFSATFGLVILYPFLRKYFKVEDFKSFWKRFLADSLLTTISAQLATLPIIWLNFGLPSIISIPANILIAPIAPLIMAMTLLVIVTQYISLFLANIFAFVDHILIYYVLKMSTILSYGIF